MQMHGELFVDSPFFCGLFGLVSYENPRCDSTCVTWVFEECDYSEDAVASSVVLQLARVACAKAAVW